MPRSRLKFLAVPVALLIALCLAAVVLGASYTPNTAIPTGIPGRHVMVRGVPLRVVQSGQGRDVLLIHGSPGSIEDWDAVVDTLSASFHVTRFDRPGQGYSGDDGSYSYEHNAEMALGLIRALGLSRVIVVGHSYGGATALAMAVGNPAEVSAYVVVDSATYESSRKPDGGMRLVDLPLVGYGFAALFSPIAKRRIQRGVADQFEGSAPPGFVELRQRMWSTPKVLHAIARETIGAEDDLKGLSPKYPDIKAPTYILAEADSPFRKATAEHLHADVKGSSLRLIPNTGHYVQFQKPSEIIDAVNAAAGS
ncbi:MAG TPA: alpha/beta hydrolase [Polyangiaceae bacterium]|nr:alpha/beta hydrolase [Polyangiaceae bacterium]